MGAPLLAGYCPPYRLAGLSPETPVAVAFSGGADSMALLHLLSKEAAESGAPLLALHVHHGIRGAEADRDAAFCRRAAESLHIPFALLKIDVPRLAKERGEGLETVAREERYRVLCEEMEKRGFSLLATAHHGDDQLETLLLHLMRGSGLKGLGGIPPVRAMGEHFTVVRPLLQVEKSAILSYLDEQHLPHVEDSTNYEPTCDRNFLRLKVLPLLKEHWPNGGSAAGSAAQLLREDEAFLTSLATRFLEEEGNTPALEKLRSLPMPLLSRVLRLLFPTALQRSHTESILRLLQTDRPHAALNLPSGTVARVVRGHLEVSTPPPPFSPFRQVLKEGENIIAETGALITVYPLREAPPPSTRTFRYQTAFLADAAALHGALVAENRQEGHRILRSGMHRLVRKLPELSHLPPDARERMPLLSDEAGLFAVPFAFTRDGADKHPTHRVTVYFN